MVFETEKYKNWEASVRKSRPVQEPPSQPPPAEHASSDASSSPVETPPTDTLSRTGDDVELGMPNAADGVDKKGKASDTAALTTGGNRAPSGPILAHDDRGGEVFPDNTPTVAALPEPISRQVGADRRTSSNQKPSARPKDD
jgi:hypothetical protein